MKKLFVLILALAMILSLAGCKIGGSTGNNSTSGSGTTSPSATQNNSTSANTSTAGSNATVSAATEKNYELAWGSSAGDGTRNPVNVSWNSAAGELKVTYTSKGNFFALSDINETQATQLFKKDASGAYQAVSGVTTKIASTGDERSKYNYGTVVLKFYNGDTPYAFESGASYAVMFDIIANKFHHSTPKGAQMFALGGDNATSTPGNSTTSTPAPTGSLTLDALKQAAKNTGFTVSTDIAFATGAPKPTGGFDVVSGGNTVLSVLEFASNADAQAYNTARTGQMDGLDTDVYKQFYSELPGGDFDKETELMAAFAAAGWGK